MAVDDVVAGVLANGSSFRPASGVGVMITAGFGGNSSNWYVELEQFSPARTSQNRLSAHDGRPFPPVFINNACYIEADGGIFGYSGIQVN